MSDAIADYNAFFSLAVCLAVLVWLLLSFRFWQRLPLLHDLPVPVITLSLFVLAVAVRLVNINFSFWYDECFTAITATLPMDRFWPVVESDVHPPLFYLLERVTASVLGQSEFAFRFWSVVAGGVSVLLVLRIGRREWLTRNQRLAAALVACFLPGLITFAQDARSYSVLAALLLTCYLAVQDRRWWLYFLAGTAALWTHYFAVFYILALGIFVFVYRGQDRRWFIATTAGIGLTFAPLLPMAIHQTRVVSGGFWISDLTMGRAIAEPYLMLVTSALAPGALVMVGMVSALLLTVAGVRHYVRQLPPPYPLLWFIFLPPVITALYSVAVEPVYQTKAFIASVFLLPVLWLPVLAQQHKAFQVAGVALLASLVVFYFHPAQTARVDWKALAARLDSQGRYFHVSMNSYLPLAWYLPDATHVIFDYPASLEADLTSGTRRGLGVITAPDLPPGVTAITHKTPENDPSQVVIMQVIEEQGEFVERFADQATGIVDIYTIPPAAVSHAQQ